MTTTSTLSGRDRAILRAVAAGGAQLQLGSEPDRDISGSYPEVAALELGKGVLVDVAGASVHRPQRVRAWKMTCSSACARS